MMLCDVAIQLDEQRRVFPMYRYQLQRRYNVFYALKWNAVSAIEKHCAYNSVYNCFVICEDLRWHSLSDRVDILLPAQLNVMLRNSILKDIVDSNLFHT